MANNNQQDPNVSAHPKVKISQAIRMVDKLLQCRKVPMIHGSPAIGKSAIVKQIAAKHNLKLIDLRLSQCDPTDLMGFPSISNNRAGYVAMDTFPIEGDSLPIKVPGVFIGNTLPNGVVATQADVKPAEHYNGWLLFLDEFNSAAREVQAASYKLVLDRMVGKYHLHSNVAIVCAGNLESDGAIVEPMSTAMQSRLSHLELEVDAVEWVKHAVASGFDYRLTSFIEYRPGNVYTFSPDHSDMTYSSPRTLEDVNDFLKKYDVKDEDALHIMAGMITEGVAREFLVFCDIFQHLPKIHDIVAAPETTRLNEEPSVLFAMAGSISEHATHTNVGQILKYVNRMQLEFRIVTLRMLLARDKTMQNNADVQKWVTDHAKELF